jgi:hypothetical protein
MMFGCSSVAVMMGLAHELHGQHRTVFVTEAVLPDALDRDRAAQTRLTRFPNFPHAAAPDLLDQVESSGRRGAVSVRSDAEFRESARGIVAS